MLEQGKICCEGVETLNQDGNLKQVSLSTCSSYTLGIAPGAWICDAEGNKLVQVLHNEQGKKLILCAEVEIPEGPLCYERGTLIQDTTIDSVVIVGGDTDPEPPIVIHPDWNFGNIKTEDGCQKVVVCIDKTVTPLALTVFDTTGAVITDYELTDDCTEPTIESELCGKQEVAAGEALSPPANAIKAVVQVQGGDIIWGFNGELEACGFKSCDRDFIHLDSKAEIDNFTYLGDGNSKIVIQFYCVNPE